MAKRKHKKPPRRQPPTEVERAAKLHAVGAPPVVEDTDPEVTLSFDSATAAQLALIRRRWDETTLWLRSIGVTAATSDVTAKAFMASVKRGTAHRLIPINEPPACELPGAGG